MNDHSKKVDCASETFLGIQIVLGLQGLGELKAGRRWLLELQVCDEGLEFYVAQQLLHLCFLLWQGTWVTCQHHPTCASTCEEFCVPKKHELITNALERDTYSRFLSTKCDWGDGVSFLHTFTPRRNMVEV